MKIFIDSANIEEIRQAKELGIISGVTTNPTLMAKEGRDPVAVLREIVAVVDGPISAEVIGLEAEEMVREGRELAKLHANIVVKIPMTLAGLQAVHRLKHEGIKTNVTLVFSASQALLAARAGATFVSPFIARLEEVGNDGVGLVREIVSIYRSYGLKTEIIAASIKTPNHALQAALAGADIATIPWPMLQMMAQHPLTDRGIEMFLKDWGKLQNR
ncbi:MAG: fructose-6-phosphate aldolase [Bacteroidota bacterium]